MSQQSHHFDEYENMKGVAKGILVMGVTLGALALLYIFVGRFGSDFSNDVLKEQQQNLREEYQLPEEEPVPDSLRGVPPSLRDTVGQNIAKS